MRAAAIVAILVASTATAHAQLELRNDGFVDNASVGFQAGFAPGEIGASRFVAPSAGRTLQHVRFLFGGAPGTRTITLHVYDDTAGTLAPGAELFSGDYEVTGSNSAMQDIDLTGDNIVVTAQFRVGIELQHMGLPCIGRDDEGSIMPNRNFLYGDPGLGTGWYRAESFPIMLMGDWIIRAVVSDNSPPIDAGTDAQMGPDAGSTIDAFTPGDAQGDSGTTPDAPTAGECQGNGDCAIGSYCNPATQACTFDCRTADDCGGDTCNSLGQCVTGSGDDGGGCCSTGDGGVAGALGLGGAVALLLSRRRRRQ